MCVSLANTTNGTVIHVSINESMFESRQCSSNWLEPIAKFSVPLNEIVSCWISQQNAGLSFQRKWILTWLSLNAWKRLRFKSVLSRANHLFAIWNWLMIDISLWLESRKMKKIAEQIGGIHRTEVPNIHFKPISHQFEMLSLMLSLSLIFSHSIWLTTVSVHVKWISQPDRFHLHSEILNS